ncbi:DUF2178 domain-containing protein [Clostridium estertheticum]|uniref:DUF2178 domain-containing protein n=1 Tax=Clostridium estertheticum TaxID=238834 RepID=A0A5N7IUS5_9CLOT|nr:DUF2178 domain-containing protein [Clostridium estertheticum]MCB2360893.1 DUF2178 domain-containing protein [Clostridium estertheticum]MPQ34050.1 DUF2178 domain-containing protein [Clostridium estertheticum]MPQ64849.1 DUF2178 domain-containing protein [Clostridium estertheticum]
MNMRQFKTTFFYGMIALWGLVFIILGAIFQNDGVIFHRMFRVGFELIAVGIVFLLGALKLQRDEKNDKASQQFNNAISDERNQFIAGKSASITTDIMLVLGMLAGCILSFFGMNSYAYIIIGYIFINSILQFGVGIYLRSKF